MTNQAGAALVALGTNMPFGGVSGPALLASAVRALEQSGFTLRARSGIWKTEPWPPSDQVAYHNAVVAVDAPGRSPQSLFDDLLRIERAFGRERRQRWGPRTLDLDLLDLDGLVGSFGEITLPHKRLQERAFVLAPLAEATPTWRHPVLGKTASELLAALPGGQGIVRVAAFPD